MWGPPRKWDPIRSTSVLVPFSSVKCRAPQPVSLLRVPATMAMAVRAASTAASRGLSTSAPATTCTGSTCTSTSMVAVPKRFSGVGQAYNALLATRVPTQGKGRAAVAMASSSGPSNGVTAALNDSPVVGNVAPDFEAEAAFDQEFVKFSHLAGIQTDRKSGGMGDLGYQSISDLTKTISKLYNVLIPDQGIAMRGLPFIDEEGVVQHSTINNSSDAPVPSREEESAASAPDSRADACDTSVHPSWLHTFLDGGAAMEPEGGVGPALEQQERHSWDKGREDTTGWTYAPDLPRGLVGRHFGGVAMASVLLGLGYTVLVGGAEAADLVAGHHVSSSSPIALDSDMRALAFGPEGPLVEEFWDNMRRYGLYFLTVASGGLYSLLKPVLDLLKNPLSAVLVVTVLGGSFYLVYLTLSTMLGLSDFNYSYS